MSKPSSPCYKCPDRSETCHGSCEKYKRFKQAVDEWRRMVDENRREDPEQEAIRKDGNIRAAAQRRRNKVR